MTVSTTAVRSTVVTDGTTGPFTFSFPIFSASDLVVYRDGTLLVQDVDYTVSTGPWPSGGTITLTVAGDSGDTLAMRSGLSQLQELDLATSDNFPSATMETTLDKIVRMIQQQGDELQHCIRSALNETPGSSGMQLPTVASRAGKVLYFADDATAYPEPALLTDIATVAALTQSIIGSLLKPQTQEELDAGVTPTNYWYDPGVFNRYGTNTTPGTTDMTSAINAALSCNQVCYGLDEDYAANNLTGSQDNQRIIALGTTRIIKNANGDLLTHSGEELEINGVQFRGDASTPTYTGHNIVVSGDNVKLNNVGSRWAYARALKCTGSGLLVLGSSDLYQSALQDDSNEYDIEVGVSGTATLYHRIIGVRTSQSTGGFHFIDCGSQQVQGCQFGKLFVDSGTSPGGVNGGVYMGNRITGNVTVEIAFSVFSGCQFSAITITFAASTGGHVLDQTNTFNASAVITNNGAGYSPIIRPIGTAGYQEYRYGQDSSAAVMRTDPTSGAFRFPSVEILNNKLLALRNAADSANAGYLYATSSDNVQLAAGTGKALQHIVGAAVSLQLDDDATSGNTRTLVYDVDTGAVVRVSVGADDSGGSGYKVLRIPN